MDRNEDNLGLIKASGLFDAAFYLTRNSDVAAAGIDPLLHFVVYGALEGRDPSADFSTQSYRALVPDLPRLENPLVHFIRSGQTTFPIARPSGPIGDINAEVVVRLRTSGLFDADWYLRCNTDVRDTGIDPFEHFVTYGINEGRNPCRKFPMEAYRERYKAQLAGGVHPLVDYVFNIENRDLHFTLDEEITLRRQHFTSIAMDTSATAQDRFQAAYTLVTNAQDQYDDLIVLFATLAQEPSLAQSATRMQALCRQLVRRAKRMPLETYRDPSANSLPAPAEDPILARESVMILRRAMASRVILVFTGNDQRVWVPVQVFQSYLPEDAHIVFLRDPSLMGHRFGLTALGFGYGNTLLGLQRLIQSLNVQTVYCIGSSTGGFSAMRYGLDLGVRRVLAFVPTTYPAEDAPDLVEIEAFAQTDLRAAQSPGGDDLRQVFLQAPSTPDVTIVYGSANANDRRQSRHMHDLPAVTLVEVPDYAGHDVVSELIVSGQLEILIQALLAP